jgi:hypothetical protein
MRCEPTTAQVVHYAVTNARFASLHRLPVASSPLSTAPVPLRKPRARHEWAFAGMPQTRQASVCGSTAGRSAPAAIRFALLSVLRSTCPARRPQTEARMFSSASALMNSQPAIDQIRIPQSLIELLAGHSANMSHSAMKPRFIVWRRRARQGYYGSVRLDAPASVPPWTRPPPPGIFASRISSREAVAVTISENESLPLSVANNSVRSYLPIQKHCVIVLNSLVLRGERLFNGGYGRTVGTQVKCI